MVNSIGDSNPYIAPNSKNVSLANEGTGNLVPKVEIESFKPFLQHKEEDQNPLPAQKARKMTESINRFMETTNTNLRFQFHEELKEYYVTIVDSKTNELVKEIPSKKLMDIYAAMRDFLGLMVDHKI